MPGSGVAGCSRIRGRFDVAHRPELNRSLSLSKGACRRELVEIAPSGELPPQKKNLIRFQTIVRKFGGLLFFRIIFTTPTKIITCQIIRSVWICLLKKFQAFSHHFLPIVMTTNIAIITIFIFTT